MQILGKCCNNCSTGLTASEVVDGLDLDQWYQEIARFRMNINVNLRHKFANATQIVVQIRNDGKWFRC